MQVSRKTYVAPEVETIDSTEIVELIGPVQGYGHSMDPTGGMMMGSQAPLHSRAGGR